MKIENVMPMKSLLIAAVAAMVLLASCAKNNDVLNSNDIQNVNSESVSDSYTSETVDMGNSVVGNISGTTYASGRTSGDITGTLASTDGRLAGATIMISHDGCTSTLDNPCGKITIDFKTGVTTNGVTRKGQIIITYAGKKFVEGSTRVITFSGYSRNSIVFDDGNTFTVTNVIDSTKFHHVLSGSNNGYATLTFPDNTTILRKSDFYVTLNYVAKTITLSATPPGSSDHSASGSTRAHKDYTMDITTPIVYSATCLASKIYIPVSGVKKIDAGLYIIDYGTGTCDNTVTITVGGKTATITVNGDGN